MRGHRSLLEEAIIGNFQGWIGVYRVQHSFLVVCPKKEKAQSRDVRVKSWLERSISHLEGGGANKMGFLHERKINRCELHNSSDADLGHHPATTDIQRSAGPSKRQRIHRRAAHPEPQDPTNERARSTETHTERTEGIGVATDCVPGPTGVGGGGGAGRPARPSPRIYFDNTDIVLFVGWFRPDGRWRRVRV